MKPFCIATIGTILGIIMGLYIKSIVLFMICVILGCFFLILLWIIPSKNNQIVMKIGIYFTICFLIFWGYVLLKENRFTKLVQKYDQKEVEIKAVVIAEKTEKEYQEVYQIQVTNVKEEKAGSNQSFKMLLKVKKKKDKNILLQYGDEIYFKGIFEAPNVARNEGGFNYQQYLKTKNIVGIITVEIEKIEVIGKEKASIVERIVHHIKREVINRIKEILPQDAANLCTGLLIGEKTELSDEIQENFRNSNLSHLLAISGAHISYILLGISTIIQKLKIHKRWGKVILILFLLFFMVLVGCTASVVRSCIMVCLQLLANILFRRSDTYQNLAISCFVILLINPYTLLDIGFQLSFGGTIGIIVFSKRMIKTTEKSGEGKHKIVEKIKEMCMVTLSANLVIIPIMMYHFNNISLTFLISNLLASPILGISLILGMIFIIMLVVSPVAKLISFVLYPVLQLLVAIAEFSSKLPFAQILVPTPKIWQIMLYYLIILFFPKCIFFSKRHSKSCFLIIIIFLIISPYFLKLMPSNKLIISFIDVGQGDSMLIQTSSHKTILIDGGGSENGSFDVGEKVLIPYLLDRGIMTIDYMLFSHFDSDHCKGLISIMKKLKVKNAIISKQGKNSDNYIQFLKIAKEKKTKIIVVKQGDIIPIDTKCYISILFPSQDLINSNVLNNNSVVTKFVYQIKPEKKFSLLLTGDVEAIAEKKIVEEYQDTNELQADILKVAHHGSKTSSTTEFLKLVKPKIALVGVGEQNTFGHPSKITLDNLESLRLPNL